MDLLDNVATELGFQFHLYLVRDELYGTKVSALTNSQPANLHSSGRVGEAADHTGQLARDSPKYRDVEMESDWDPINGESAITR